MTIATGSLILASDILALQTAAAASAPTGSSGALQINGQGTQSAIPLGTNTQVLHGNASGAPAWGAVSLGTDVIGNLSVTNLGSGSGASITTFWRGDGTWATPAGGGGAIAGPGTTVSGFIPTWNGTSGAALGAGLPVGLTGNNTIIETTSSGLLTASVLPLATTGAFGAVKPDGTSISVSGGVISTNAVTTVYTSTGALTLTDTLSIVNSASNLTMTLANDTVDQRKRDIKRFGSGTVSVTAVIDGTSQTIVMNTGGTVKENLTLRWITALSSYVVI